MDYKALIDRLIKRSKADESGNSFATICSREDLKSAATAITDLLARAEESEAENAVLRGGCGRAGKKCEHWEWKGDKHGEFETTDR